MKEKYVVVVDTDIAPIMPRYMELRQEEMRSLTQALRMGDAKTIALLGHRLKGSAASYGMDMLTGLGDQLEQAGRAGDFATAQIISEQIHMIMERVELVYKETKQ